MGSRFVKFAIAMMVTAAATTGVARANLIADGSFSLDAQNTQLSTTGVTNGWYNSYNTTTLVTWVSISYILQPVLQPEIMRP